MALAFSMEPDPQCEHCDGKGYFPEVRFIINKGERGKAASCPCLTPAATLQATSPEEFEEGLRELRLATAYCEECKEFGGFVGSRFRCDGDHWNHCHDYPRGHDPVTIITRRLVLYDGTWEWPDVTEADPGCEGCMEMYIWTGSGWQRGGETRKDCPCRRYGLDGVKVRLDWPECSEDCDDPVCEERYDNLFAAREQLEAMEGVEVR